MFESATLLAAECEEMPSVLAVPLDELVIGLIAFLIVFGGLAKFVLAKNQGHPGRAGKLD